jgi:hypothetical protein
MDNLPNELLAQIIDLLDLQNKFLVRRVSKRWKQLSEQQIKSHKRLAIGSLHVDSLFPLSHQHHFQTYDLVPESLVAVKNSSCWPNVIKCLPAVTGLRVDCEAALFIQHLLQSNSHSITSLICPNWTFGCNSNLPQLVVLAADSISHLSFQRLITGSPNLAAITFSRTNFREWERLPHGLRSLTGGELAEPPFDRLFSSPAAVTLELLSLRSSVLSLTGSYQLPQLRELEVGGFELLDDNLLLNWAQTLSSCHNLCKLHISTQMDGQHLAAAVLWNTFFASVSGIQAIYLNLRSHRLEPMSQIMSSLVENCPNVREITLPYSNVDDNDMGTVSRLNHLQKFRLYCNSGPVTESGIVALMTGEAADSLNEVHVFNNYKFNTHSPPMTTLIVKEKVMELRPLSARLEYLDHYWHSESEDQMAQ